MPFEVSQYGTFGGMPQLGSSMSSFGKNVGAFSSMAEDRNSYRKYIDGLAKLGEDESRGWSQQGQDVAQGKMDWNAGDSLMSFAEHGGGGKGFQRGMKMYGAAKAGGLSSL